jgi:hypothetical protein
VTSGDLEPGQVIESSYLPLSRFLDSLVTLVESPGPRSSFVAAGSDGRARHSPQGKAIERDLVELLGWAVRRLRSAARGSARPATHPLRVLTRLPRRSLLAHVLRRAVPFAALGIPVVCSAPIEVRADADRAIQLVGRTLALGRTLRSSPWDGPTSFARMPSGSLVVFTGRRRVLASIASRPGVEVIGSTGRCSVLAGTRASEVASLLNELCTAHPRGSCTRPRVSLVVDPTFTTGKLHTSGKHVPLAEALRRSNPSVLFVPASDATAVPSFLYGYRVIPCGLKGDSETSRGLGRDPRFGWPGDYLI